MSERQVLIIGGGISGLATAWWLTRMGFEVELWEAEKHTGGKIASHSESGYLTEQAAGILVNYRKEVDQLIGQLGLDGAKRIRDPDRNRYLLKDHRLQAIPMQLHRLLGAPLWSWKGRLRMACEPLIPRQSHAHESVADFIRRRLGREPLDIAFAPFVCGTLASDPEQAEAASVLPRLVALEQRYGSLAAGMLVNRLLYRRRPNQAESFSFENGMAELIQALANNPKLQLVKGRRLLGISRRGGRWQAWGEDDRGQYQRLTRHLVLTTPAPLSAELLSGIDSELAGLLAGIEYAPIAVVHLGLARKLIHHPLDGTGFLASPDAGAGCNGNLWMSRLFPNRAPRGRVLLTSYLGGARQPDILQHSDSRLCGRLLQGLGPLLGIRGEPEYLRVDRHPLGLPLYHGNYSTRCRLIEERIGRLPGLHLSGNYLHGVSVRDRIVQGLACARRLQQNQSAAVRSLQIDMPLASAH